MLDRVQLAPIRPTTVRRLWQLALPAGLLTAAVIFTGCDNTAEPRAEAAAAAERSQVDVQPGSDAETANEAQTESEAEAERDAAPVVLTGADAEAAIEAGDATPYPLDVCIVSGEPLGAMGGELAVVYDGQTIKFCCPGCDKMFLEAPEDYLSKLDTGDESGDAIEGHEAHDDHDHHGHDHDHG